METFLPADLPSARSPLSITVPTGPLPEDLALQRQWAELRKLQVETERAAAELESFRRKEAQAVAEDARRIYTFYGRVDDENVKTCMSTLASWSAHAPSAALTVVFNSPGGAVHDGLALFDFLRQLRAEGHHLTTMGIGRVASMGAVLLQAGDRRVVGANAFLMLHEVSNGTTGRVSELEESVELSKRLQRRLLSILAERSSMTMQAISRRWMRRDWWLDADDAVSLGFADEVR
jgi:ATP-dependent Clp endopeptidase proteolytic subunit ClpP